MVRPHSPPRRTITSLDTPMFQRSRCEVCNDRFTWTEMVEHEGAIVHEKCVPPGSLNTGPGKVQEGER
jgi:hypothetical protein